eukprot:maker-scaffold_43-snap-gene-1.35-mRNA-1 protein AED:0.10 eAED:0.10 QI:156/1/1/1/0.5/0.33/3/163/178
MGAHLVSFQKGIQAEYRPAIWSEFASKSHEEIEQWTLDISFQEAYSLVRERARDLNPDLYEEYKAELNENEAYFELTVLTPKAKWLDMVSLSFKPDEEKTVVYAKAFSTGFLPLTVPFAPIFNTFFFWVPFLDPNGECSKWLQLFRKAEKLENHVLDVQHLKVSLGNPRRSKILQGKL